MPFHLEPPTPAMQALAKAVNAELGGDAKVSLFTRIQDGAAEQIKHCVLIAAGTRRWTVESELPLVIGDKDEIVTTVRTILNRPRPIASKYQAFDLNA